MRNAPRTIGLMLAASLLLAVAVGSASARSISASNQQIRGTFSRLEFVTSLVTIRCVVTLEGSFHTRTISKVTDALIGAINRAAIKNESCTNGTVGISQLPWHITYVGFTGTLPNMLSVRDAVGRFRFQIRTLGISCDYGNESDSIGGEANLNEAREIISIGTVEGANAAHRVSGTSELCPGFGNISTTGSISVLGSTTRVRLTLI